jgi:hypothetical protein
MMERGINGEALYHWPRCADIEDWRDGDRPAFPLSCFFFSPSQGEKREGATNGSGRELRG